MTERRKFDLRASVVSAVIGAAASLLVAGLTLAATFGGLSQQVAQIAKDIDRLVVCVEKLQTQNTSLCERIASLEARVSLSQAIKGGIQP